MTLESHPVEPLAEVLRELAAIKQGLTLQPLSAIPLDAFLFMLRDVYKFTLPKRTAQDMIVDGRIPILPRLRARDMPWVNLTRWREMASKPDSYARMVQENVISLTIKSAAKKSAQRAAA